VNVEYASIVLPMTEELLIDAGLGTPEMIARDRARSEALAAWARSRPLGYRIRRRVYRAIGPLAGRIALWAERQHDRLHTPYDAGCALCVEQDRRLDR
jgi:hypothetical protein